MYKCCLITYSLCYNNSIYSWINVTVLEYLFMEVILKKTYKKDSCHKSIIRVGDIKIGGDDLVFIGGPCSVENEEQIVETAIKIKEYGGHILRGGAFKPRTSPYDFQGHGADGLKLLEIAKKETGLPIISEITSIRHIDLFENVDILQIGARNMQNYELLKEVGNLNKPVLLKRGFSNTLNEFLLSAEYILNQGNENVILCERGIRTFETWTRNTMDISAIPLLKDISHLPIISDPSHATGIRNLVQPMSLASVSAGCDGLMIEVHNNPELALSDKDQAITPEDFKLIVEKSSMIKKII